MTVWPISGGGFVFVPFVPMDRTFALEADVDHDEFVIDFDNLAFDNLVDVELLVGI